MSDAPSISLARTALAHLPISARICLSFEFCKGQDCQYRVYRGHPYGVFGSADYTTAKHGVVGLTQHLACEGISRPFLVQRVQ
jgi:NAD(P)-dependent dehydrogenase (short-subunit alcohol dehydrogenase family)